MKEEGKYWDWGEQIEIPFERGCEMGDVVRWGYILYSLARRVEGCDQEQILCQNSACRFRFSAKD